METTTHPPKLYWKTCGALMLLLALTWSIGYVNLGLFNLVVALTISVAKALLVGLFFMHLKGGSRLLHLAAVTGFIWLIILLSLTLGDYVTCGHITYNTRIDLTAPSR
jgi:cytochrome c oxidase subunit 4